MKKTATVLACLLSLCWALNPSTFAESGPVQAQSVERGKSSVSVDRSPEDRISLGSVAPLRSDVEAGPGLVIATTADDWQYTYKGTRVDMAAGSPNMYFMFSAEGPGLFGFYGFTYNSWDPVTGQMLYADTGRRVELSTANAGNMGLYPDESMIIVGHGSSWSSSSDHEFWGQAAPADTLWALNQIPPLQYGWCTEGFVNCGVAPAYLRHPIVEIQLVGGDTISHVTAGEGVFTAFDSLGAPDVTEVPLQYYRKVNGGTVDGSTTWDGPVVIDTASSRAHLAASRVTSDVAIIYFEATPTAFTNNQDGDQDVCYRESNDAGLTWQPRVNITNYDRTQPSYAPFIEKYGMYDSQGELHILWSGNPWPADVYDSASFFFGDFSASLFHWSTHTGAISKVADRDYGLEWNTLVCGFGSFNALYLAFFSMAECNGRLYVAYAGWQDLWGSCTIDDCASPSGRSSAANGELYLNVSTSLAGTTWDDPRNLTNTYTPGCNTTGGGSVCMNETKPALAPFGFDSAAYGVDLILPANEIVVDPSYAGSHYINLTYVEDRYPGAAVLGVNDPTANPVKWARIGCVEPGPSIPDADGDKFNDNCDNCPNDINALQENSDADALGDACDNCPNVDNADQADADGDGLGDVCDACPNDPDNDIDGDGVCADVDNCPTDANPGQEDSDNDGIGDVCETTCCVGATRGNVDGDVGDVTDVGDLTALIAFLFLSSPEPDCLDEANIDGAGQVDVGDLTALIAFLFLSGSDPAPCP